MMKKRAQFSRRDWRNLSAYLDDALPPRQQQAFERQMETRPELRRKLRQMEQSRAMIRALPPLRAPRNFTLQAHMLPARPGMRAYPILRLASVLASVLFVVLLAGDLFGGAMQSSAPAMQQKSVASDAVTEAPMELMAAPEAPPLSDQNFVSGAEQPTEVISERALSPTPTITPSPVPARLPNPHQMGEVALAVLALLTGGAAWVLHRRGYA